MEWNVERLWYSVMSTRIQRSIWNHCLQALSFYVRMYAVFVCLRELSDLWGTCVIQCTLDAV